MKYSGNISILRQIRRELSRKISRTKVSSLLLEESQQIESLNKSVY